MTDHTDPAPTVKKAALRLATAKAVCWLTKPLNRLELWAARVVVEDRLAKACPACGSVAGYADGPPCLTCHHEPRPPEGAPNAEDDAFECERCEGTGDRYGRAYGPKAPCPDCDGTGVIPPGGDDEDEHGRRCATCGHDISEYAPGLTLCAICEPVAD